MWVFILENCKVEVQARKTEEWIGWGKPGEKESQISQEADSLDQNPYQ